MNLPLCLLPMFLPWCRCPPEWVGRGATCRSPTKPTRSPSSVRGLRARPRARRQIPSWGKVALAISLSRYARLRHLRQLGDWGPSKTSQVFPSLVFPGLVFGISQFPDLVFRRQIAQKTRQDTRFSISLLSCAWTLNSLSFSSLVLQRGVSGSSSIEEESNP